MANYAIIRVQKFKTSDVQGIQKHNQRQGKSKSNLDIDYKRSHLNVDLLNDQKIRYEQTIKSEISERVKRKPRANSVVLSEFLVTASPGYMKSLSMDEQQRYFERSLDFIKERYGEQNTLYAVVHQDEANPHMHVGIVPITEDGRLSAKDMFQRTELQALQKEFPAELQRHGFEVERGKEGSKEKHLHPNEYKEKQDLEKEVKLLVNKANEITRSLPREQEPIPFLKKEIETEVKPKLIGKPEIIEKETENYVLTPDQFKTIEQQIHAAVYVKKEYEWLKSTDLVKKVDELERKYSTASLEVFLKNEDISKLQQKNHTLEKENSTLKAQVSHLTAEIKLVYKSTKEFIKERTKDVRGFKSALKDFVDKVKGKTAEFDQKRGQEPEIGEFEKTHKWESRLEQENELSR